MLVIQEMISVSGVLSTVLLAYVSTGFTRSNDAHQRKGHRI